MNIQRYVLPVSFAAAFHAALLFGFSEKAVRDVIRIIEVTLPPLPPKPDEPVVTPPPEPGATVEPVKPLAGGPTPPEIEPPPALPKTNELAPPEEARPRNPGQDIKIIPPISGPGETGRPGLPGGEMPGIFSKGQLDREPLAKVQPSPDYPARMRQDGVGGSVVVEFVVNTMGVVVRAEAVSYTHREFVEPALRAVRNWRFEPGRRDGRVVPFRLAVPIEFGIERN